MGVVKNITIVICEDKFVLNVMFTTLYKRDPHDQPSLIKIRLSNLLRRIELNLVR